MSKYIWLNDEQETRTAIMLDKIDSLRVRYVPYTDLCTTSLDKYVLDIYTSSRVYAEEYSLRREANKRMDEILELITRGKCEE